MCADEVFWTADRNSGTADRISVSRSGKSACAAVVCRERSGCGKCFSASSGLCFMLFGQKNIHSGSPIRKKSLYLP